MVACIKSVSYTHLDVYKRQVLALAWACWVNRFLMKRPSFWNCRNFVFCSRSSLSIVASSSGPILLPFLLCSRNWILCWTSVNFCLTILNRSTVAILAGIDGVPAMGAGEPCDPAEPDLICWEPGGSRCATIGDCRIWGVGFCCIIGDCLICCCCCWLNCGDCKTGVGWLEGCLLCWDKFIAIGDWLLCCINGFSIWAAARAWAWAWTAWICCWWACCCCCCCCNCCWAVSCLTCCWACLLYTSFQKLGLFIRNLLTQQAQARANTPQAATGTPPQFQPQQQQQQMQQQQQFINKQNQQAISSPALQKNQLTVQQQQQLQQQIQQRSQQQTCLLYTSRCV